jgi:hypothetical protein
LKSIEDGCQVDSIYTDFDKVRHCLFLDKTSTDVEPSRWQWLCSYFSGRIQRVKIGVCVSRDILVTLGATHGSHLGPLCFIWFVNEISRIFRHVQVLFYANDMELFRIQNDLNRTELNVGKSKSITFSRIRHPTEFSYMLGGIILDLVVVDSKMSFTRHID